MLLLHGNHHNSAAQSKTVSSRAASASATARPHSVAGTPAQHASASAPASSRTAAREAQDKARETAALQKRIVKLEQEQHNAEALSKVAKQDASIKSKISAVMHHVEQVDKEKQAPALGDTGQGNTFTTQGGKVVATSLSKSTIKAMKEAQLAGLEADDAARARAAAEARKNYEQMRDEMFRKDAMKQVQDEQQLRAEKKVCGVRVCACLCVRACPRESARLCLRALARCTHTHTNTHAGGKSWGARAHTHPHTHIHTHTHTHTQIRTQAARAGAAHGQQIITQENQDLIKSLDKQTRREDPVRPPPRAAPHPLVSTPCPLRTGIS